MLGGAGLVCYGGAGPRGDLGEGAEGGEAARGELGRAGQDAQCWWQSSGAHNGHSPCGVAAAAAGAHPSLWFNAVGQGEAGACRGGQQQQHGCTAHVGRKTDVAQLLTEDPEGKSGQAGTRWW